MLIKCANNNPSNYTLSPLKVPDFTCKAELETDLSSYPDSKVHGANMGSTWVLSSPDGTHVCPMYLAIWVILYTQHSTSLL